MAKPKKPPLTPQEYHELPIHKKVHTLAMTYMNRCDPQGFTKSGLFKLRNYFAKHVDPVNYQVFYDYLYSLQEPTVVSLYDIYGKSQAWQMQLRMSANKPEGTIEQYPSLLDCLKGL